MYLKLLGRFAHLGARLGKLSFIEPCNLLLQKLKGDSKALGPDGTC